MNLKKRIAAISTRISPDPKKEARQRKLMVEIEAARKRAGINKREPTGFDYKPGALYENLAAARTAHLDRERRASSG